MLTRVEQAAVILLPMQLDQRIGERAQHIATGTPIIDPGHFAPIGHIHTAQEQARFGRQACGLEQRKGGMARANGKLGHHLTLSRACAHQIGTPPPPKGKAQRIEQDGFSRACFTGQHV